MVDLADYILPTALVNRPSRCRLLLLLLLLHNLWCSRVLNIISSVCEIRMYLKGDHGPCVLHFVSTLISLLISDQDLQVLSPV